ncbi:MAG: DUF3027 domain-containing protein [Actinomycetes bacterium]
MTTTTSRRPTVDAVCAAAEDLARAVAEDVAGADQVGAHLGVEPEGERIATHYFASLSPAYRGWRWAVTVARVSRSRTVTVAESVLVPGEDAVLAPEWLPWSERLKPGDLGVGDLLPTREDDDRLEPGYTQTDEEDADAVAVWELGLGRVRVLSATGRDDAVDRWYSGDRGPRAPIAEAAPATCTSCGFFLPLAGSLRPVFGVCANEFSPSDGLVVSYDHGCGAHSEAAVMPAPLEVTAPVIDEVAYDVIALHPVEHSPGSVDDAIPPEDLGHS